MRRQPLGERSESQSNTIRLIEETPPRLPTTHEQREPRPLSTVELRRSQFDQPSSSVFPTLPSQILPPPVSHSAHLFQGSALQDRQNDVSRSPRTTPPQASTGSSASSATAHQPLPNSRPSSGQRPKTPRSSKLKHVAVRADKTFSVLDLAQLDRSQYPSDWSRTPTKSSKISASESSHEQLSSYPTENYSPTKSQSSCTKPSPSDTVPIIQPPSTPKKTGKLSTAEGSTQPSAQPPPERDPEIVGGIRVVPKTPDSKKAEELPVTRTQGVSVPLPSNFEASAASTSSPTRTFPPILTAKSSNISAVSETPTDADNYVVYTPSAQSQTSTVIRYPIYPTSNADSDNYQTIEEEQTPSASSSRDGPTPSHNSNYEVYDSPSPIQASQSSDPPPSRNSNYEVYETPSPSAQASPSLGPPPSRNSNYEVYHSPSSNEASPSASSVALIARPSQDSLTVAPLQPRVGRSHERLGYYKSRSRETLRTAPSLASISSILTQEATRAVFGSPSVVQNFPPPSSFAIPGSWADQALSRRHHMQAHPHQWSSQLSTVLSESDGLTDRGSGNFSSQGRRSSGFMSTASRQPNRGSGGSYASLERPQPAYARRNTTGSGSSIRVVGAEDEHGDSLTDMQDLRVRPSRSRLSLFSSSSSENLRRNSIQSTTSSRANSLLVSTIPAWARLYYGSGERRWLAAGAPGSSTDGSIASSRPGTPHAGSPNTDHFPLSIYSPRRRPRETNPNPNPLSPLRRSLEIEPAAPQFDSQGNVIAGEGDGPYARHSRRWRTSSIWSPHLRLDRRAARMSVWEPPSFSWSTEDAWTGRRNIQVVLFVFGFIFPFAWMIAAFLPLPPNPVFVMRERNGSDFDVEWSPSHPDITGAAEQNFRPVDESRYESAKWWRRLNRCMSFVGVLIIGTIIALVIVGKQDWGKS